MSSSLETALKDPRHSYHALARVLVDAFHQCAVGKGKERHALAGQRFEDQFIVQDPVLAGTISGLAFQLRKKAHEAEGMARREDVDAAQKELLGAIVYAAAMHVVAGSL